MKRLIAAGVLIILITLAYITELCITKEICEDTIIYLDECVSIYNSDANALTSAQKIKKFWKGKENFLSVFVNHQIIDDIERAIDLLTVYSDSPDNKIFYEYSQSIRTLIHQLMEDTIPTIHSIL